MPYFLVLITSLRLIALVNIYWVAQLGSSSPNIFQMSLILQLHALVIVVILQSILAVASI